MKSTQYGCVILSILLLWIRLGTSFDLTILHTNDVHSHFIEFNAFGGRCTPEQAEKKQCFGGFARQSAKAQEIRSNEQNVLYLNGGDFFQGTMWYTMHKWTIVRDLVNYLGIDAMSLGNHEFDDGLKGLYPYLDGMPIPVLACNINATKEPKFREYVNISTIIEKGGEKFGIIGYITPDTKFLSSVGDLEFEDEIECISREAIRLENAGINKLIAVGHSGFAVDKAIAQNVPQIDIVVGGHSNTFLYTGKPPSVEVPQGPYPVVVERPDGSKGLVVQDFAFGKYLGYLHVSFNDNGEIVEWEGNPILLDGSIPRDNETLLALVSYELEVQTRSRQVVGHTNVLLQGQRNVCRMKECNLGNFLADAALHHFIEDHPATNGWSSVAIALWNSGSIRGSIDERINGGNITLEDILTIAPFGNTMDVVGLKGKDLKEVLEHSVKEYDREALDPPGSFLQVSGLRVTYNVSMPQGERVIEVMARCADCRIPKYLPLEDEKVYEVALNTYMAKGGDGFSMIPENLVSSRNTDDLDIDIIIKHAKKLEPITIGLEDRIVVLT